MIRSRTSLPARWLSLAVAALLFVPLMAGLAGTLLPAFGYLPALGRGGFSLEPWHRFAALPGIWTSVGRSLATGIATTLVSLGIAVALCAAWHGTAWFRHSQRLLAPLLSVPHAAAAFGISFLLAPSGWLMRWISPSLTGFARPPDWLTVHDPHGISLTVGLVVKEVPFLLIMMLAAMAQSDADRSRRVALSFGYGPMTGWLKGVFPRLYPQIRLPVLAVLAYGISVVDVAMILGPTNPHPLAVRLVRLFNDPDLSWRLPASAGAMVQGVLVGVGIVIWTGLERWVRAAGSRWVVSGRRHPEDRALRFAAGAVWVLATGLLIAGLAAMGLWAFADGWRFPEVWPDRLTWTTWERHADGLRAPLVNTLSLALGATGMAMLLAVGLLEAEARSERGSWTRFGGLLYLPLIVPQVAFLFGAQILLLSAAMDGRWLAVAWMHLVFVFPYVFLTLSGAYRAWDRRFESVGMCLGASRFGVFLRVKLPMLLRALTAAAAVGFSVSVGQYLPTLLIGGGRLPTITTEAVALAAGGDLRVIALHALVQMALPLMAFGLAVLIPGWQFRNRRALQAAS